MDENVCRGRGRPKKDDEKAKGITITLRLGKDDLERLNEMSKWAKMSRSETVRSLIIEAKNYYLPSDQL